MIEVVRRGSGRWLRLRSSTESRDSNPYRAASLYFILTLLKFIEGTVLKESVEDLWERSFKNLPAHEQQRLGDFDRKFYAVPYAPKIYRAYDDQLDVILRALIGQNTIHVDYGGLSGASKEHQFDPYTLITHRGRIGRFAALLNHARFSISAHGQRLARGATTLQGNHGGK